MGAHVVLGIDTGGTYTDAVLVELSKGEVLAPAKALTLIRIVLMRVVVYSEEQEWRWPK